MKYEVHGITVDCPFECGIYQSVLGGMITNYGSIKAGVLINDINRMSIDKAIEGVERIQNIAAEQMGWEKTPVSGMPPILVSSGPGPRPIEEVRDYIENTRRFCSDILAALYGY
jgi:hypothetical protein